MSRKKRLAEQRKTLATLKQTQNLLARARTESKGYSQRLATAERRMENATKMPPGLLEDLLSRAMREATFTLSKQMAQRIVDVRRHSEELACMVEAGMLIRSDDQGYMTTTPQIDNGGTRVTFEFPAFRWTQFLDRHILEDMMGRSGPMYMPDRPIHVAKMPDAPVRLVSADAADRSAVDLRYETI